MSWLFVNKQLKNLGRHDNKMLNSGLTSDEALVLIWSASHQNTGHTDYYYENVCESGQEGPWWAANALHLASRITTSSSLTCSVLRTSYFSRSDGSSSSEYAGGEGYLKYIQEHDVPRTASLASIVFLGISKTFGPFVSACHVEMNLLGLYYLLTSISPPGPISSLDSLLAPASLLLPRPKASKLLGGE